MPEIHAYPLCWPVGWKRTPVDARQYGRFSKRSNDSYVSGNITVAQAVGRIRHELGAFSPGSYFTRCNPDDGIVSTNVKSRLDGLPYSNQKEPDDPGAAVYFNLDGRDQCIAVDRYTRVAQNLAAIAAIIGHLRGLERHGGDIMERSFTGFIALPAPITGEAPWREVMDIDDECVELDIVEDVYRSLRSTHHPDKGGDAEKFQRLQRAMDQARTELQ